MACPHVMVAIADPDVSRFVVRCLERFGFSTERYSVEGSRRTPSAVWISDLPPDELAHRVGAGDGWPEELPLVTLTQSPRAASSGGGFTSLQVPISERSLVIAVSRAERYRHLLNVLGLVGPVLSLPETAQCDIGVSQGVGAA